MHSLLVPNRGPEDDFAAGRCSPLVNGGAAKHLSSAREASPLWMVCSSAQSRSIWPVNSTWTSTALWTSAMSLDFVPSLTKLTMFFPSCNWVRGKRRQGREGTAF